VSQKLNPPLVALLTLPLAACAIPISGPTTKGALDIFRPLHSSVKDTCATQAEIAEHNSRYDTAKTGKETVYKAPCEAKQRLADAGKP
jgi:hypothetical protein